MRFEELSVRSTHTTRLAVRARPSAPDEPVLLFCDGLGCDGFVFERLWAALDPELGLAHFQYPGHGASERYPAGVPSRVEDFARDLELVRRALDRDVIVVGHSLGVQVALEAHRLAPSGIAGLVLVNGTSGRATSTFKGVDWLERSLPGLERFVRKNGGLARGLWRSLPVGLAIYVGRLLGDIADAVETKDMRPYFEHLRALDVEFFLELLAASGEHDAADHLPAVDVPSLVVGGRLDTFTPVELSERIARGLAVSELAVFEDCTHLLPLEAPERLARSIERFVGGLRGERGARASARYGTVAPGSSACGDLAIGSPSGDVSRKRRGLGADALSRSPR